jgi:hypothetical protein
MIELRFRVAAWSVAIGLAVLALAACEGPPTVGESRDFAGVCDRANDGHRVAVEGYMRLPDTITVDKPARGGGDDVEILVVRLFRTPNFDGTPIGVDIDFGSEPNTMDEIPNGARGYTDADLKVHAATGQTVTYGQRVKISGRVYFPVSGLSHVEFTCGLSNPLIEPVTG